MVTKALIGNQTPRNFPVTSPAEVAKQIAQFTSQLHMMPCTAAAGLVRSATAELELELQGREVQQ